MPGYSTREVAELLDLTAAKVRSFARDGLLSPRPADGNWSFSFQDIVLLRAAKELERQQLSPRKIRRALRALRERLPARRPLTSLRIAAAGDDVVVHEQGSAWQPESGQTLLDFTVAELAPAAAPIVQAHAAAQSNTLVDAEDWFLTGLDLESVGATEQARDAYTEAAQLDPSHAEARINLGRLAHARRDTRAAASHYRAALAVEPQHPTALFNLGVALEDDADMAGAIEAYRTALRSDPDHADAHYNLARLLEASGDAAAALRHLARYRELQYR